ncbi:glycosyltransferase [Intrasporangium calvum]|uniref:glycosyltransferase n=1 Tax=Intrasporangium calvum TaxID=53358 RepID=UPI000DF61A80|nr:nucleotide disphospho-sugar-binding domain-containing protein [Intrasporangium calvum]AXG15014.1 glycosyltransferase [Intrasporangium calvum]
MSTILAYTSPAFGHLFPMMPLLLELRARGHSVHVRTLSSHVDAVREAGLTAEALDPAIGQVVHRDWTATNPVQGLKLAVRTFSERAPLDGPDLERAIGDVRPDALIVDTNSWGAQLTAQAWGGPWVSFVPFTPPISSPGTPPFGPGFAPWPGLLGRVRDAVARPLVIGAAERVLRPKVNPLRAERGLPPIRTADELYQQAPLVLVTTSEPFEYPHPNWGDRIRMIGALTWEPPTGTPAWLQEIEGPLVLVTTSSEYQRDEALVRAAAEGLAGEPYTVIATMPCGVSDVGSLPPNVRVVDFVPHGPVLERAVAAVTHGGMGATQKALARGVPVCVVPFGRDQLEVAARVVHAGAGTRLASTKLTPQALRDHVRAAMAHKAGAERVAAGYRTAGGAAAGATAVEELLERSPARSS